MLPVDPEHLVTVITIWEAGNHPIFSQGLIAGTYHVWVRDLHILIVWKTRASFSSFSQHNWVEQQFLLLFLVMES